MAKLEDSFPNYDPLLALVEIAQDPETDLSMRVDCHKTLASYLTDADSQLDIDGDGESKPLTDGLLLIRYLFGFSGDSLISGAIGDGAERDTAEEVDRYISNRLPAI